MVKLPRDELDFLKKQPEDMMESKKGDGNHLFINLYYSISHEPEFH